MRLELTSIWDANITIDLVHCAIRVALLILLWSVKEVEEHLRVPTKHHNFTL